MTKLSNFADNKKNHQMYCESKKLFTLQKLSNLEIYVYIFKKSIYCIIYTTIINSNEVINFLHIHLRNKFIGVRYSFRKKTLNKKFVQ